MLTVSLLCALVVDAYIFIVLRRRCRSRVPSFIQLFSAIALYVLLIVALCLPMRTGQSGMLLTKMWLLFGFMTAVLGKLVFVLIDAISLIPIPFGGKRWRWLAYPAAAAGIVTFVALWWGALVNRFNIDTTQADIEIPGLPASLDGYRIVQLSDLHVGTYGDDTAFVSRLVDHVNSLKPDLIVLTGDIVNRRTDEILPFIDVLSRLHAAAGVYSILGNHDYGDYYDWDSDSAKARSLAQLVDIQRDMGWHLLLNSHAVIHAGADSIALVGVENVGDPPFKVYGDLSAAYPDLSDGVTKILLTHNPVHWDMEVAGNDLVNVALTLSGHTHAMQIRLLGLSPAAWRYDHWGGLYSDGKGHQLYVNIGVGTVGLPMRLGATPEVTLFTLRRK